MDSSIVVCVAGSYLTSNVRVLLEEINNDIRKKMRPLFCLPYLVYVQCHGIKNNLYFQVLYQSTRYL